MNWPSYSDTLEQRLCRRHTFSAELIDSLGADIFVDVGCGQRAILASVKQSHFRLGIERTLQDAITARTNSACSVVVADASWLPLRSQVANVVGLQERFEHIDSTKRATVLNKLHRVLLSPAHLLLSVPYNHIINNLCDPAWYIDHTHFSQPAMAAYFANSSFTVINLFKRGGVWEIITMLNLYVCKWFFNKDLLCRAWFETKRTTEFDTRNGGFHTLFVVGRKE